MTKKYNAVKEKVRHAKWYASNKEAVNARHAEYRTNNPEKEKTRHAKQYKDNKGKNNLWRQKNPDKQRAMLRTARLRREFGLTIAEYAAMSEGQNHKCAICGKPETSRRLAVDHCHETGKIRALLCGPCNNHLGTYELHRHKFETYLAKYGAGS